MPQRFIALPNTPPTGAAQIRVRCPSCGEVTAVTRLVAAAMICPWCDFHFPWEAGLRLEMLVDPGSFSPLSGERAGAARFGWATVGGRPLAVAVADPLAGWTDADSAALIALAEAAQLRHQLLLWVATGPRKPADAPLAPESIDEEFAAAGLEQLNVFTARPWPAVAAALDHLRDTGLSWITLVSGSCVGPMAAVGLQADLVLAEPGSEVGLLSGQELRQAGVLTSGSWRSPQGLLRAGWADAVVPRLEQRATLAGLLDLLGVEGKAGLRLAAPAGEATAPSSLGPLAGLVSFFFELHGDRQGEDDPAVVAGLAQLENEDTRLLVLTVAHRRGGDEAAHSGEAVGAAGWLKITRLLRLAGRLALPVVILVGRPYLRAGRRERPGRLSFTLGETLRTLLSLPVPTLSIRLDGDESLPAMALTAADRVLAAAPAVAGLQEQGLVPDGAFAGAEELKELLVRQLQEVIRTYTGPGPLGRRQLLQRRHARWAHRYAGDKGSQVAASTQGQDAGEG